MGGEEGLEKVLADLDLGAVARAGEVVGEGVFGGGYFTAGGAGGRDGVEEDGVVDDAVDEGVGNAAGVPELFVGREDVE